jgi:cytochrome P450
MYREEEKAMGPIRAFAERACQRAQPGSPLALLQDRPSHSRKGANILSKDMIDEAITLLFAGQDTSAATLSWSLHLLSLYPKVQERLAEEVRSVLHESDGRDGTETSRETCESATFTKKMVSKMPFLDAVIKESMRLYPVAPFVVRKLQHDVKVVEGDSSTQLPSGAFVCIWIYGLHRNPQLWSRPNDFVPDRWIDPSLRALDAGQEMMGAFMPFAAGPRSCLGQPLANVILRIVLARIIHQYQFTDRRLSGGQCDASKLRKDMQAGFTVLPAGGLKLAVSARADLVLLNDFGNGGKGG